MSDDDDESVLILRRVLELETLLLHVQRDEDGLWLFTDGDDYNLGALRIVGFDEVLRIDPSIAALSSLRPGGSAHRPRVDAPWTIVPTMTSIACATRLNAYGHLEPTIVVDDEPIATRLARLIADDDIGTLVSTLLSPATTCLSVDDAVDIRARLLPEIGETRIAPLLMCPDDLDLSCTVVVVEVEVERRIVTWKRFGRRVGNDIDNDVDWWPAATPLVFGVDDYRRCIAAFDDDDDTNHYA